VNWNVCLFHDVFNLESVILTLFGVFWLRIAGHPAFTLLASQDGESLAAAPGSNSCLIGFINKMKHHSQAGGKTQSI
jgi:prophage tail gpP-like protein